MAAAGSFKTSTPGRSARSFSVASTPSCMAPPLSPPCSASTPRPPSTLGWMMTVYLSCHSLEWTSNGLFK